MDHHEILQTLGSDHLDTEGFSNATARAIASDDIATSNLVDLIRREIADSGGHTLLVLFRALPLLTVFNIRSTDFRKRIAQHSLEAVLRNISERRRREAQHFVGLTLEGQSTDLLSRQIRHPPHLPRILWIRSEFGECVHIDTYGAADLEAARVDDMRSRCANRRLAPIEASSLQPLTSQEQRSHQTDWTSTHDQDRNFDSRHLLFL